MHTNHIIKLAQYKTDSQKIAPHFHTDHEIIFVTEGVVEFIVNGKSIIASKGDMVFLSNFESHSTNILKTPYKRYNFTISSSAFEDTTISCPSRSTSARFIFVRSAFSVSPPAYTTASLMRLP